MKKKIPLSVIVDAIEATTDGWRQFYNIVTGEVDAIPSWDNVYINPEEYRETADKIDESDDYVELPTQRELHEYDIMERFAEGKGSERLLRALRGRKPFRAFKDRAIEIGLDQEYYAFRSAAYLDFAREWCRKNEIPFTEEATKPNGIVNPEYEKAVASIPLGRYRHFRGNPYEVIGIARHSETEEPMVVYKALYGDGDIWVSPVSMWNETIIRDGKTYHRFYRLDRIERVEHYERLFDEASISPAPEKVAALTTYYTSGEWLEDYEADERGELPPNLKRGVLSQDALYDLLEGMKQ